MGPYPRLGEDLSVDGHLTLQLREIRWGRLFAPLHGPMYGMTRNTVTLRERIHMNPTVRDYFKLVAYFSTSRVLDAIDETWNQTDFGKGTYLL